MLFTFPSRYWFTIGQSVVFSLTGWSPWIPAGLHVSCGTRVSARVCLNFDYRAVTVSGRPFHAVRLSRLAHIANPTTPIDLRRWVWAVPRSLAATRGIEVSFFSSGYLDVSVPRVGYVQLCIHCTFRALRPEGFPIRKSPDQCLLAAPRSLSQLSTSFFASDCLGIHHTPFVT